MTEDAMVRVDLGALLGAKSSAPNALRLVAERHQLAKELRQQADHAQTLYVEALRQAIGDGHSVVECATAAGLGRHAVYAALRRREQQ